MKSTVQNLLLAFCSAFLMFSCTTSESEINPLVGTWTLKGVSCQNCIDKTQEASVTYVCNESGCNTYTFNAEGSLKVETFVDGKLTVTQGTYSVSNSILTIHISEGQDSNSVKTYAFNLNGSSLYLNEIVEAYSGKCSATTVLGR